MSQLLEANYQRLLKPFKNANVYFPSTLEEFLRFTKQELDNDESLAEHNRLVVQTLLRINETTFPHECAFIRKNCQSILSITTENK